MSREDMSVELEKLKAQPMAKGDRRMLVNCDAVERIVYGSRADPSKTFGRKKNRATRALDGGDAGKEWRSVDMESDSEDEGTDGEGTDGGNNTDGSVASTAGGDDHDAYGGVKLTNPLRDRGKMPGPMIRSSQLESEVNFSVGGERGRQEKIEETPEAWQKRREGERRAEEREMVRRAARRLVAFGVIVEVDAAPEREEVKKGKGKKGKKAEQEVVEEKGKEKRKKCEAIMNGQLVEASYAKGDWSIRWRADDWKRG